MAVSRCTSNLTSTVNGCPSVMQLLCEALVACTRGIMGEGGGDCLFNLCLEINTVVLFILEKCLFCVLEKNYSK